MIDKSGYSIIAAHNTATRPWWHKFFEWAFPKCFGIERADGLVCPRGTWTGYVVGGTPYMTEWKDADDDKQD